MSFRLLDAKLSGLTGGSQATYTFPVGVTTLWWFAAADALDSKNHFDGHIYAENNGQQLPLQFFK